MCDAEPLLTPYAPIYDNALRGCGPPELGIAYGLAVGEREDF